MDREILFRGKRLDKFRPGEWIYGYYVPCCFGSFPCRPAIVPEPDGQWEPFEVDPSTVGQYTGLTDKNGKKIFDGDVLRLSKGGLCVVKYGHRYRKCGFVVVYVNGAWDDVDNINGHDSVEVISNIHDNPELMGGEGDG